MTRNDLLEDLKSYCVKITSDMVLPTSVQQNDTERISRAPEVYKMRLIDSTEAKKYAPYIIVQFINGTDRQEHGKPTESTSLIRMICCVYSANEEEGAMMLLNVMDRIRIALLKDVIIANGRYKLDTDKGIETLVYPDDTAPYYAGEMVMTFFTPSIERRVSYDF